ncbi:unnamed protein product [Cunninghamella echinulata]
MVSVRLQLFKIMNLEDKMALLHACSNNNETLPPTFASIYKEGWTEIEALHYGNYHDTHLYSIVPKLELNFFEKKNKREQDNEYILTASRVDRENMKKEDYTTNITSIEFGKDDEGEQLALQCDMYYQLDGARFKGPKPYNVDFQSSTHKFGRVIIPLYRFRNMECNKANTPSDCYLSISRQKKSDMPYWKMVKGFEFDEIAVDNQFRVGSYDVGLNGMILNGMGI